MPLPCTALARCSGSCACRHVLHVDLQDFNHEGKDMTIRPPFIAASVAYPDLAPLQSGAMPSPPASLTMKLRVMPLRDGVFPQLVSQDWSADMGLDVVVPCHTNPKGRWVALTGIAGKVSCTHSLISSILQAWQGVGGPRVRLFDLQQAVLSQSSRPGSRQHALDAAVCGLQSE